MIFERSGGLQPVLCPVPEHGNGPKMENVPSTPRYAKCSCEAYLSCCPYCRYCKPSLGRILVAVGIEDLAVEVVVGAAVVVESG